ncbi:MAG TPA: M48 family metalloprotease [Methylomirabilota bacterium]|nr:M48 family metalloprotease [Methylomirabilota bacterium]
MPLPDAHDLTRRQCCAGLIALLGGLATGGCATVSPREEQRIGREEAEEVERTVGLVRDPRVTGYIAAIGQRLVRAAGRADIAWQWNVADEPAPNAFAVPGGWVYVTRGLLALANREDEVAGVLAHEMAHVIERHSVRQAGAATPLAVLFGVPSGILGVVSPTLGGIVGGTGRLVAGLTLAPYSREQEREADRIGVGLAARAGWDPGALGEFLGVMERAEALSGATASGRRSFFATHPSTPERMAAIETVARSASRVSEAAMAASRAAFLGRLEGLVIGDNAAHGVFVGPLFLHADLDLALQTPAGWTTANTPKAAGAVAPEQAAAVLLQAVGRGNDPVAGARADGLTEPQVAKLRRFQISGLPAADLAATTRDRMYADLTWIAHRGRIFRVTGVCHESDRGRYRPIFEQTAATFRPLTSEDRPRIVENRLRVRSARAGESVAEVVSRSGSTWPPPLAAVANGVSLDRKLEAGWPVKVSVTERYRPASGSR